MADEYLKAALYGMKRFNEGAKRIINMERLIKLLNEYNYIKEDGFVVDDGGWEYLEYDEEKEPMLIYQNSGTYASGEDAESILISRQYGFIKRLVENEKIDLDGYPDIDFFNGDVNNLLMYLAIQDEPIEFLISILK